MMLVIHFPRNTKRVLRRFVSPRRALFILYAARKRGLEQRAQDFIVSFYAPGENPIVSMFPTEKGRNNGCS